MFNANASTVSAEKTLRAQHTKKVRNYTFELCDIIDNIDNAFDKYFEEAKSISREQKNAATPHGTTITQA